MISGISSSNIVMGGIVTIKDEFGKILAQTTTDENGEYNIDVLDYEGAINLALTCNKTSIIKTDKGEQISCNDFNPMYALVPNYSPADTTKIINITPLTTLVYESSRDIWGDLSTKSANEATQTVSKLFPDINLLEDNPSSTTYSEAVTKILKPEFKITPLKKIIPFLVENRENRDININQEDLHDVKNLVNEIREQSHVLYNLTPTQELITPHFDYTYIQIEIEESILPIYQYMIQNSINTTFRIEEAIKNNQEEIIDTFLREDEEMQILLSKNNTHGEQEQWSYKINSDNGDTWEGEITFNRELNLELKQNGYITISGSYPLPKKSWIKKYQDNLEIEGTTIVSTKNGKTNLKLKGFTRIESKYLQISNIIMIDNSSFDLIDKSKKNPFYTISPNFIDIRATNNRYGLDGKLLFKENEEKTIFNGTLVNNITDSVYEGSIEISDKNNFKSIENRGNLELINISRNYTISSISKTNPNNFYTLDLDYTYSNKEVHISFTKEQEEDKKIWEVNLKDETQTYLHMDIKEEEFSGKITKEGKTLGVIFSFYGLPIVVYADKDIALLF